MSLTCILSKNIVLTIMYFKISDTNRGKKCLLHNGYSYIFDVVLKSGDISWRCINKKCKGRLRTDIHVTTCIITLGLIARYNHSMGIH